MEQSPQQGTNRTGIMAAGRLAEEMIAATREFPPSSPGSGLAMAEVRIACAREVSGIGNCPGHSHSATSVSAASGMTMTPRLSTGRHSEPSR